MFLFQIQSKCLVIGVFLLVVANATTRLQSRSLEWAQYMRQFNKTYEQPAEKALRFANYLLAQEEVKRHNKNTQANYRKALNHMSDWHVHEFAYSDQEGKDHPHVQDARHKTQTGAYLSQLVSKQVGAPPDQFDWRKSAGRVGPVKSQDKCDASWAFATTGVLEGQQVVRNISQQLVPLSEQELIDCSSSQRDCNGGSVADALLDVATLDGIESESSYPYDGKKTHTCTFNKSRAIMTCIGSMSFLNTTEEVLQRLVFEYGPISIGVDATSHMVAYESGIFEDQTCAQDRVTHNALIVGYGSEPKAGNFWIIKNSWGEKWGERGYMRMRRGLNMCGLLQIPTLALF